ncbi:hypothetical protein [Bradyrhizobium sp.]|jgi:hypothetical protein|uniref:hypothetical protein n=1 Tax=Bradyrhizobium sp. TaxID=376 RepID=UPI002DDC9609|nr:hypothetical protein [Bradyrhizobium sp.]HEV2155409.1 hypothetical protein [Bradyrhizobium sp.]
MQTANILLSLGGHHGNTVPKFGVTAAEIAVLRAIHGDESIKDVEPGHVIKTTHRTERDRLLGIYGGAKFEDGRPIVESLFPGVAARVHETLAELELPGDFFKATGRMSAEGVVRQDGPTVSEWVAAGYAADAYPPTGYASKSTQEEIDAAIAQQEAARKALSEKLGEPAADEGVEDDGIGDIDDGIDTQGGDDAFA